MNNPSTTPPSSIITTTSTPAPTPRRAESEQAGKAAANWHVRDRRKHRRFPVARPGKVFRRAIQQFTPVHSQDLSFSGALLEIESSRPFTVGEILDVGLAMNREPVVPSSCMVQAIVVRAVNLDASRQTVAVRYVNTGAAQLVN